MNIDKEKIFVNRYIMKKKRERILYELSIPSKRIDALSRFCHNYEMYIDERKIMYSGKEVGDEALKKLIKKSSNEIEGYMICWDERYDSKDMTLECAIDIMKEDGMCMIFISEDICIISTEQTQGPKEIVMLRNIM